MVDKGPVPRAIDESLRRALGPSLKAAGFRKKGRTWSLATERSIRAVQGYGHPSNGITSPKGSFQIELGFTYPSLGEAEPQVRNSWHSSHRLPIGMFLAGPAYRPWTFADANEADQIDAVVGDLRPIWEDEVLPTVLACDDPAALYDVYSRRGLWWQASDLAARLGDEDRHRDAAEAFLVMVEGRADPATHKVHLYLGVAEQFDALGIGFDASTRRRVETAIAGTRAHVAAAEARGDGRYVAQDAENVRRLTRLLGSQPTA